MRHNKRVHEGLFESEARPTLKCPECDYTTNWGKSKIKNHIKTVHENLRPLKCKECEDDACKAELGFCGTLGSLYSVRIDNDVSSSRAEHNAL